MFLNLGIMTVIWFFMSLKKCDVKIDVTPSRLEKYMVFIINTKSILYWQYTNFEL